MKTGGASDFLMDQKLNPEKSNQRWQAASINKKTLTNDDIRQSKID
jgi:hypothetical protein